MIGPTFDTQDSEDALWDKLATFAQEAFGVTAMLYAFTHSKFTVSRTGIMPSIYLRHSYPEHYLATFEGGFSLENSVAAKLILDGGSHLYWAQFTNMELTPAQRDRIRIDNACGMGTGLSMGFRFGANSGIAGLCWAAEHEDATKFERAITENGALVADVTQTFQLHMRRIMIANRIKLSPREREVLSYSAGGMTAKQIASHVNLSQKTVSNTLERARRSMGAVSTMEAVAKALVYELIQ
jgi:DNA-binding CsgD family transcriptional regulator